MIPLTRTLSYALLSWASTLVQIVLIKVSQAIIKDQIVIIKVSIEH